MSSFRHRTGEASLTDLRDDGLERFGLRTREVPGLWGREADRLLLNSSFVQ